MNRKFAWFCILALTVAAGYFLFDKEGVFSFTIPFIQVKSRNIVKEIDKVAVPLKKAAVNALSAGVSQVADLAVEKSGEVFSQAAEAVKKEAFNALKGAVEEKVNSLGVELGVGGGGGDGAKPAPVNSDIPIIFSFNTNSPANFTIKNRGAEKLSYEVDWRDGEKSSGEINAGKSANVFHSWKSAGEYQLKFKIFNSKEEKIYQILISII